MDRTLWLTELVDGCPAERVALSVAADECSAEAILGRFLGRPVEIADWEEATAGQPDLVILRDGGRLLWALSPNAEGA